jgi:hypothetical protein
MADLLFVEFRDINGMVASTSFYLNDPADAGAMLTALKAASNALITRAELRESVPIVTLINNTATNNNVETARTKAKVRMRGADAGSPAAPFAFVTLGIPAPIGALINGPFGDNTNTDVNDLMSHVLSQTGVQMSTVQKIYYAKSR